MASSQGGLALRSPWSSLALPMPRGVLLLFFFIFDLRDGSASSVLSAKNRRPLMLVQVLLAWWRSPLVLAWERVSLSPAVVLRRSSAHPGRRHCCCCCREWLLPGAESNKRPLMPPRADHPDAPAASFSSGAVANIPLGGIPDEEERPSSLDGGSTAEADAAAAAPDDRIPVVASPPSENDADELEE